MDYLQRDAANFSDKLWNDIDSAVVETVKSNLKGRQFIPITNLGTGIRFVQVDQYDHEEIFEDNIVSTSNRKLYEIVQLYSDFWLNWRDLAASEKENLPFDLSQARAGAETLARAEDNLIFYGNEKLDIPGLINVKGNKVIEIKDWWEAENAFLDIAKAVTYLEDKARYGNHTLIVSSDLYVALQRIQPGTGEIVLKRISKLIDRKVIKSNVLKPKTALLVAAQQQYIDLVLGQDICSSYIESVDLNHHLRIIETVLPRIKAADAIVVFKEK
ncbi:family 1 encapsulin nanocompartment shell protein [Mycoplasma sp. P36-A1]|uniref:family 1 encapsulin nanocompartment shell protein n=1 Tax=Mycoplasma sp. P36-A1 TaxID=3252900 RepID=UPI003C2D43E1